MHKLTVALQSWPRERRLAVLFASLALFLALIVAVGTSSTARASHSGSHTGTFTTWDLVNNTTLLGFDPHETIDDASGLTNQVGSPAMVTAMENIQGNCGILYWNPTTNQFKGYVNAGSIQIAADLNRSQPASTPGAFGGGDVWATIFNTPAKTPYVNFRGTNTFRNYNVGANAGIGVRVNS